MIYAVKSVENSEVNKIYADWVSCKDLVWGKSAVYKSFPDNEYEAANKFLNSAPVAINEFGHGYIPSDLKADIVYGRYKFDRCPEQENGFSVRVYEGKNKERVTCRVLYAFSGKYIKDKKYGYQFEVESFDECVADTKDGIVAYLSSGVIKGIGSQKAEAIYEKFGDQTLEVIEKDQDKLLSIKNINKKKILLLLCVIPVFVYFGNILIEEYLSDLLELEGGGYLMKEAQEGSFWWVVIMYIQVVVLYVLSFIVLYTLRKNILTCIDKVMYRFVFWIIYVSTIFYFLNIENNDIFLRWLNVVKIPMIYLLSKYVFNRFTYSCISMTNCFVLFLLFAFWFSTNIYIIGVSHINVK